MSLSKHSNNSAIIYNEDIMSFIFMKLPVKSVLKCKCVCKIWQSITSNPHFCHQHTALYGRNPSLSSFILKHRVDDNSNFEFCSLTTNYSHDSTTTSRLVSFDYLSALNTLNLFLLSSCNGLLLFQSSDFLKLREYYVCNPTTKKSAKLALPNYLTALSRVDASLAFDPCVSPYYKVVFLWRSLDDRYCIAMYTSETKTFGKVSFPSDANYVTLLEGSGVFFNGKIHWHALISTASFYFDVEEGCVKSFPLPPVGHFLPFQYFGESRGRLYAVMFSHKSFCPDDTFIYELEKDYSGWFLKHQLGFRSKNLMLCYFSEEQDEGSTLIQLDESGEVAVYNLEEKTTRKFCRLNPSFNNHDLYSRFNQVYEDFIWSSVAYQWIENLSCV